MKHCPLGLWRLLVDSDDVGDYFLILRRVLGDMQPLQLKESLLIVVLLIILSNPPYHKLSKSLIILVYLARSRHTFHTNVTLDPIADNL
jgi:hypothetical protein